MQYLIQSIAEDSVFLNYDATVQILYLHFIILNPGNV